MEGRGQPFPKPRVEPSRSRDVLYSTRTSIRFRSHIHIHAVARSARSCVVCCVQCERRRPERIRCARSETHSPSAATRSPIASPRSRSSAPSSSSCVLLPSVDCLPLPLCCFLLPAVEPSVSRVESNPPIPLPLPIPVPASSLSLLLPPLMFCPPSSYHCA